MPPSRSMRTEDEMSVQEPEMTHVSVAHPSASETIPSDVPVASVELEDLVPTTLSRRFLLKRPPNPLDRVEPPTRTRSDEDDHSAFSAYHHDLKKVSEILKNGDGVFSGTGMPDMLDSAWLAIKTPAETLKKKRNIDRITVCWTSAERCRQCVGHSQFFAGRRDDTTNLQQSRSINSLQCDGQTATCRSESVNSVTWTETWACQSGGQGTQRVCQIFRGRGGDENKAESNVRRKDSSNPKEELIESERTRSCVKVIYTGSSRETKKSKKRLPGICVRWKLELKVCYMSKEEECSMKLFASLECRSTKLLVRCSTWRSNHDFKITTTKLHAKLSDDFQKNNITQTEVAKKLSLI